MEIEKKQIEDSKTDPQCFEPLYLKYHGRILKFVYNRVESFDDCKEITSIVFSKALLNLPKYEDKGFPFSSWLYRIAINEINLFYRQSKKRRVISLDDRAAKNLAEESESVYKDLLVSLQKALLYLAEEELNLIELRYFEERPFSEVGEILEITENNAKVRTYRVLDKLKVIYSKLT